MRLSVALLGFMLLGQTPYAPTSREPIYAHSKSRAPAYYVHVAATGSPRRIPRFAWYEEPHTAAYSPATECLYVSDDALPHPPNDPLGVYTIGVFCGIHHVDVLSDERDVLDDKDIP